MNVSQLAACVVEIGSGPGSLYYGVEDHMPEPWAAALAHMATATHIPWAFTPFSKFPFL